MTLEEALVALLTLVAGVLLFVGLAQALDTPRPRRLRESPRGRPDSGRRRVDAGAALERHARGPRVPLAQQAPVSQDPEPSAAKPFEPGPRPVQMALLETSAEPPPREAAQQAPEAPEPQGSEVTSEAPAEPLVEVAPAESPVVAECLRMYQEGEYAQVLEAATPVLRGAGAEDAVARTPCEQATLWSVLGLAHQALGDRGSARQAFEAGLAAAGTQGTADMSPGALELATLVAGQIVAAAEASTDTPPDLVAGLAVARALAALALAADPGDEPVRALAARAEQARWSVAERRAAALMERREFD